MSVQLFPIAAFEDNYFWVLHDGQTAWVVDPGDAGPLLQTLQKRGLKLGGILVTHYHLDHVGGIAELLAQGPVRVYAPAFEPMPADVSESAITRVQGGEMIQVLALDFEVLAVAGHTAGHVAYCFAGSFAHPEPILFCGDTLFSAGCGRLEDSAARMHASLQRLSVLDAGTLVCCAHEYTLQNLRFAAAVEPHNPDVLAHQVKCQALRAKGLPTLPSTMGLERRINPFLRTHLQTVRAAIPSLGLRPDGYTNDEVYVFAALREWKNTFR